MEKTKTDLRTRNPITLALPIMLVMIMGGCATEDSSVPAADKPLNGKADSVAVFCESAGEPDDCDVCQVYGWYDDGVCDQYCEHPDADCAAVDGGSDGGTAYTDASSYDTAPDYTSAANSCHPVAMTGCDEGEGCYPSTPGPLACTIAGPGLQGDTCRISPDCSSGFGCFGGVCHRFCDIRTGEGCVGIEGCVHISGIEPLGACP